MSYVTVQSLGLHFKGEKSFYLNDINFELEKGQILALVGESGSGKTTILRILGGLEIPNTGSVTVESRTMNDTHTFVPPEKRNIGYVFQEYALFPHMSVWNNVAFGISKLSKSDQRTAVNEILAIVGLEGYEQRFPHELSGGEQQRVALARALVSKPSLLLLDEPFSNLDFIKKDQVRRRVKEIIKRTNTTAIFVTHDTREALSMADKVIVLKEGKILQQGLPKEIYNTPANDYVAYFFGKVNLFDVQVSNEKHNLPFEDIVLNREQINRANFKAYIRPEGFEVLVSGKNIGVVKQIAFMGNQIELIVSYNGMDLIMVTNEVEDLQLDESVNFSVKPNALQLLP